MAERAGFEPAVLSHTAFRERHHQPLGHLSAGEDTKGVPPARTRTLAAARSGPGDPGVGTGGRCRHGDVAGRGEEVLGLVTPDAADHLEAAWQPGVLSELDHGPGGALEGVRERIDEGLDIALEERADAHRAGFEGREDRDIAELGPAELSGGLAEGDDDRVSRGVI